MPYYGRQVARLKGIGKYINWNQGGGPKKAGLGPSVDVTTWGRRVIARRTNNCCCDPIELTSVQMSLPGVDRGSRPLPGSSIDSATISPDTPWNEWSPTGPGSEGGGGGGYVGPPRNNIDATGTIRSTTQIYAIFTFNKPISASSSPYKFNPSLPPGTKLEVIGLKKVDRGVLSSPLGAPVGVNTINPPGVDYYIRESNTTPVIQIPGGTEVRTFNETDGRLTDGSRFLIDSAVVTGVPSNVPPTIKKTFNSSNARLLPDMQSGLNNSDISGANVNTRWYEFPVQSGTSAYGAFNRRLDISKNGGFAPVDPPNPFTGERWNFSEIDHYLGNIFGVYTKTLKDARNQYQFQQDEPDAKDINPRLDSLNIRLVQSNRATQVGATNNYSTLVENYSADAAYISTGKVPWLGYEHALFINITSIMQIMLKNPTANAVPRDATVVPQTNPAQARFYSGNPLSLINNASASAAAGIAGIPAVVRPNGSIGQATGVGFLGGNSDWRNSNYNAQGKYATFPPDTGLVTIAYPVQKAGPWQISSINGTALEAGLAQPPFPNEKELPSWCDATWNRIGLSKIPANAKSCILWNGVTLNSGGLYPYVCTPPAPTPPALFSNSLYESIPFDPTLPNTTEKNCYHILFYGHVVEKMRQLTYAGFSSYIIRDILSSKYNCGNDGFDGPIADIVIPSGDRRITTTDNTTEAGLLTFDSNAPSYPLPVAATPAVPPTVTPTPPGGGGGTTPPTPTPPGPTPPGPVIPPGPVLPPSGGGGGTTLPTINPIGTITLP